MTTHGFFKITPDHVLFDHTHPELIIHNKDRSPPWLIVDFSLAKMIITSWPIQLWYAQVIDPVTKDAIEQTGASSIRADAGYTRAIAVKLIKPLSTALLFGEQGAHICHLLDKITQLSLAQVKQLATLDHSQTASIYSKAWNNWLTQQTTNSIHLDKDHAYTLAIPLIMYNHLLIKVFHLLAHLYIKGQGN